MSPKIAGLHLISPFCATERDMFHRIFRFAPGAPGALIAGLGLGRGQLPLPQRLRAGALQSCAHAPQRRAVPRARLRRATPAGNTRVLSCRKWLFLFWFLLSFVFCFGWPVFLRRTLEGKKHVRSWKGGFKPQTTSAGSKHILWQLVGGRHGGHLSIREWKHTPCSYP